MTWLFIILAIYAVMTVAAAYFLSEGFRLDFSITALFAISLVWPLFAYLIAVSYYEEWRLRAKRGQ